MRIFIKKSFPGLQIFGVEEKTFLSFVSFWILLLCLILSVLLHVYFRGCPVEMGLQQELSMNQPAVDEYEPVIGLQESFAAHIEKEDIPKQKNYEFEIIKNMKITQSAVISTWSGLFKECMTQKSKIIEDEKQESVDRKHEDTENKELEKEKVELHKFFGVFNYLWIEV